MDNAADFDRGERGFQQEVGLAPSNVGHVVIAGNLNASNRDETAPIVIVKTRKPVTAADIRANRKDFSYNEIKVGEQMIFETTYRGAFAVVENKLVLVGSNAALRKMLARGKPAELSPELQRAVKDTDLTKTLAFVMDLKALAADEKFVTIYNRGLGGLFGDAASGGFLKKLESLSLEGSLNKSDAVFWGSLTTKDAETAADAQKVVEAAQVLLRGRLQALPRMPKEVLDAIKGIKFTVEGAKVKATGQIKVDAVVKWIEDQRNPELRLRDDQAKQEQSTNQAATDQNKLGLALARRGKVDEAIVHYRKALEIDPDFVAAHNNLGLALAGRGQVEEAIVHYRKALMIRPDNADAYNNLGAAMAECGRVDEAIAYYRKALEIRPDNAEVHNNLGIALAGRGQVAEAIAHFQSALKIKPDLADAHSNLGLVLAGRGQIDEAIAHYRKALEIKPDYENAHNNLGAALASRGQLAEAIVHYRKALEIKPDNADAHNNLGGLWPPADSSTRPSCITARPWKSSPTMRGPTTTWASRWLPAEVATRRLRQYQKALALATARNDKALADVIRARIKLHAENKEPQAEPSNGGGK